MYKLEPKQKFFLKNICRFLALSLCVLAVGCNGQQESKKLTDWVNPFIGTAPLTDTTLIGYTPPEGWRVWAGLTYPGVTLPNAMVQLSPITEYGTGTGYQYEDSIIKSFAHTNKGHWNLGHIPILPVTGKIEDEIIGSTFEHDSESAYPGYYQVLLQDYDVNVELTTTLRTGFHKYTFPEGTEKKIVFDLSESNEDVHGWEIKQVKDNAVAGYQNTGENVYFYVELNKNIEEFQAGNEGGSPLSVINLGSGDGNLVELKIGISFVSQENAKRNL
jgi:putative alpha-1,2-mannosidase